MLGSSFVSDTSHVAEYCDELLPIFRELKNSSQIVHSAAMAKAKRISNHPLYSEFKALKTEQRNLTQQHAEANKGHIKASTRDILPWMVGCVWCWLQPTGVTLCLYVEVAFGMLQMSIFSQSRIAILERQTQENEIRLTELENRMQVTKVSSDENFNHTSEELGNSLQNIERFPMRVINRAIDITNRESEYLGFKSLHDSWDESDISEIRHMCEDTVRKTCVAKLSRFTMGNIFMSHEQQLVGSDSV